MTVPVKQLNIRLTEATHRELKAKCALDGLTLVEAVEQLVRAYLDGSVSIGKESPKPKSRLENLREFYRNPTTPLGKILVEAMPLSGEIEEPQQQPSKPQT